MKILCRILPLICLSAVFSAVSCSDVDEEIKKPYATVSESGVTITLVYRDDMKYATIFRNNYESKDSESCLSTDTIGQIIPTDKNEYMSFPFIDEWPVSSVNSTSVGAYTYWARYQLSGEYINTDESDKIELNSGNPEKKNEDDLKCAPLTTYLLWNGTNNDFNVKNSESEENAMIKRPAVLSSDDSFYPAFIIQKGKDTRSFPLTLYFEKGCSEIKTDSAAISMTKILPYSYFNTDLTIKGILWESRETGTNPLTGDEEEFYEIIHWTLLREIGNDSDTKIHIKETKTATDGTSEDKDKSPETFKVSLETGGSTTEYVTLSPRIQSAAVYSVPAANPR